MNKRIGEQIDSELHTELVDNFNDLLSKYSILVDTAEKYYQNVQAKSLFDESEKNKIIVMEELIQTLVKFIPEFLYISILESKLK